jgi:hypothetical protein
MVDVKEESCHFKSCEVAPCTNRLSCDIFDCFTSIKPHNIIFSSIEAFYKALDCNRRKVPDRISLFIIELSGCIEHELS